MSLLLTDSDENALFCSARAQACRLDTHVDALPAATYFQGSGFFALLIHTAKTGQQ